MLSFLQNQGFPVVPGAVWCADAPPAPQDWENLAHRIPLPWILRSSAATEDDTLSSMAGCYRSEGPLHSPGEAAAAFFRVREIPPAALDMSLHAGRDAAAPAVLVQTWQKFSAQGVVLVLPDGDVRVEGSFTAKIVDGAPPETLPPELEETARHLALRAARTAGLEAGADMEWGADPETGGWRVTVLQLRPLAPSQAQPPAWMRHGTWHLDRAHHPRPLSFLYASVADQLRLRHGVPQGTWHGRLYECRDASCRLPAEPPAPMPSPSPMPGVLSGMEPVRQKLSHRLDSFLRFTRDYLRRKRSHRPGENCLAAILSPSSEMGPGPRALRFCRHFPRWWDLEAPSVLDSVEPNTPAERGEDPPWQVFAQRVDTREQDDWVFALMLHHLREAFLAWAGEAIRAGLLDTRQDVFLLTVEEVLGGHFSRRLVEHRRLRTAARMAWVAPETVVDGVPTWPRDGRDGASEIHGQPTVFGMAAGPAFLAERHSCPPPPGAVMVVHALAPQDIVHLNRTAALVVELPGAAGHAMLIARELGIPAVTGAAGCTRLIPDGAFVRVDGSTGRVWWNEQGS